MADMTCHIRHFIDTNSDTIIIVNMIIPKYHKEVNHYAVKFLEDFY